MEANAKFGVTVEKSVRDLLKMRNEAWDNGKIGEAIRAEELRLKATGLLVNKQHVMHEDMNSLSREQIIEKLEEFKNIAVGRMRNVTPDKDVRVRGVNAHPDREIPRSGTSFCEDIRIIVREKDARSLRIGLSEETFSEETMRMIHIYT